MIKHTFIFEPQVNMVEFDRWYFRFHGKEVPRFSGPWLRRYETYRAYDAPSTANRFDVKRGRYTELWYDNVEAFKEADPNRKPYTAPSFGWEATGLRAGHITIVPARPTEDFLAKEPTPEERPILRWIIMLKYPEGVPVQEGEKWYLQTFAQQAKEQPGLLRFISYRTIPDVPIPTPWQRVTEMWYEDFAAWQKAVAESSIRYAAPPWRKEQPFVDMVSTFVGYKPDVDFLRDNPLIP